MDQTNPTPPGYRLPDVPEPSAVPLADLLDPAQYRVVRDLGGGGMGVVCLAHNVPLDRPEVLKVLTPALVGRPDAADRFLREMRAAAKLDHANVVRAYSAFRAGDRLVFAMEYVAGTDLAKLVKENGPLPVPVACLYARQAALGLQHALDRGLIHRDIKPHNLMLRAEPDGGHTVKVLDFGLAKAAREGGEATDLTGPGQVLGTPDYVAPEQARDGAAADTRADVYSLGCTLYFLLAGRAPFGGRSVLEVLTAHMVAPPTPLPGVPADLWAVIARMLAKDPAGRYQTPGEAAQALAPFAGGQAELAETATWGPASKTVGTGPGERPGDGGGRRWLVPAAVAAGLAAVAAVAAVALSGGQGGVGEGRPGAAVAPAGATRAAGEGAGEAAGEGAGEAGRPARAGEGGEAGSAGAEQLRGERRRGVDDGQLPQPAGHHRADPVRPLGRPVLAGGHPQAGAGRAVLLVRPGEVPGRPDGQARPVVRLLDVR
jgi:hypothetical protein